MEFSQAPICPWTGQPCERPEVCGFSACNPQMGKHPLVRVMEAAELAVFVAIIVWWLVWGPS